jgi:hypothetical protein
MRNLLVLSIIAFLIFTGCGPKKEEASSTNDSTLSELYFPYDKTFDWKKYEIDTTLQTKKNYAHPREWMDLKRLYVVDINGDGKKDYIYSGSGGAGNLVEISLSTADSFVVFTQEGVIGNVKFVDGKVQKLFLADTFGAAPPMINYSIIRVNYQNNVPSFKKAFFAEKIYNVALPTTVNSTLSEIEVLRDSLIVRSAPIELDTPYQHILEMNGNQLGKINKGTKAVLIGEEKDSLKRSWSCIAVHRHFNIFKYPIPFDPSNPKDRIVWVESAGIKKQ